MISGAGNSERHAIGSLNCPPFIAIESCREYLGVHSCDRRINITKYRELFPAIDFSLIETEEDVLWKPKIREENQELAARGMRFMNWLSTRREKEIAVVTHSGFLHQTLNLFGNDCDPTVKNEISAHFANCEIRSVVLVDKCMKGSDQPVSTNYFRKISSGENVSSNIADEK